MLTVSPLTMSGIAMDIYAKINVFFSAVNFAFFQVGNLPLLAVNLR